MASDDSNIFRSARPAVDIPENLAFSEFVFDNGAADDKVAIINAPDGTKLTYGALKVAINRTKNGLVAAGFKAGDMFAIHMPNIPAYAIMFHAVASLGGTVTTSNPLYNAEELAHQLKLTGARFLLTLAMFKEAAAEAAAAAGVERMWVLGEEPTPLQCEDDTPCPSATFNAKEQLLVVPFSSGTSGLPKGVELTHFSVVANITQLTADAEHSLKLTSDDVVLGLLPVFHIYGMALLMSGAMKVGATVVMMPKFEPPKFLAAIAEHKVTWLPVVPPIVVFLGKHPIVDSFDLSSVRFMFSGAAPLSAEVTELCSKRVGVPIGQGYGMTELSPGAAISTPPFIKPGCAGRLLPNTEAVVVDPETGARLGPGEANQGELWIRGPQTFHGYLKNPEATAATLDADGWVHTGDIAWCSEEGDVYITDRLKELIKVKGFQVAPAELEGLLLDHPKVANAAVIGVPDDRSGEVPKAFVVLKAGQEATAEEVIEFVAGRVTAYKQVKVVEFVGTIPCSASGKILRRVLRAQEKEKAAAAAGGATEAKPEA